MFKEGVELNKRRKFTPQFKAKVVLELLIGAKTTVQARRACGPGLASLQAGAGVSGRGSASVREKGEPTWGIQDQDPELERMVGKLTMELEATADLSGPTKRDMKGSPFSPSSTTT